MDTALFHTQMYSSVAQHCCSALLLAHLGYALLLHHIVLLHRRRKSNVELVLLESVEEFELLFVL